MSAVDRNYDAVEGREQVVESLSEQGTDEEDKLPGEAATQRDLAEAQTILANEADPEKTVAGGPDLRVTETIEFRGHPFEFAEPGDGMLDAAKFRDVEDGDVERGMDAAEYVYEMLGKVSDYSEEYWRRYDPQDNHGAEGVMTLFSRIAETFQSKEA